MKLESSPPSSNNRKRKTNESEHGYISFDAISKYEHNTLSDVESVKLDDTVDMPPKKRLCDTNIVVKPIKDNISGGTHNHATA